MNRIRFRFKKIGWPVAFEAGVQFNLPKYVSVGNDVFFNRGATVNIPQEFLTRSSQPEIVIDDKVTVGSNTFINALKSVHIEKNVLLAGNVYISDHQHAYEDITQPIKYQGAASVKPVLVKENAWIGNNSVINPGVTIGKNSIVGANSVVTHDVPDYAVVAGVPAKLIRKHSSKLKKWVRTKEL